MKAYKGDEYIAIAQKNYRKVLKYRQQKERRRRIEMIILCVSTANVVIALLLELITLAIAIFY